MSAEVERLEPGPSTEHRLAARERHHYRLALERGQFASVAVEQRGLDVVVRLFAPSGELVTEVDSPTGARGVERVTEVAAEDGAYRVEVEAFAGGAEDGSYAIGIEALRPATDEDRPRVEAQRAFARGEGLRRERRYEEALAEYESAQETWSSLGDRDGVATALYRTAWMLHELERLDEAVERYRGALDLFRELGDARREAALSNRLGRALLLLGRLADAGASHRRALELFAELEDRRGEAAAANNLGNVHKWAGRTEEALAAYERALRLWEAEGERRYMVTARLNMGDVYLANGDDALARATFERALAGAREPQNPNAEAAALLKLGEALAGDEELEEARRHLEQALRLRRELEDRRGQAVVLSSLGTLLLKAGDLPGARRTLEEALAGFEEVGDPLGRALAHHKLGRHHYAAGDPEEARRQHELALPLFRQSGDRQGMTSTRYGIARALYDAGDYAGARTVMDEVLETAHALRAESHSLQLRGSYLASRRHYWDLYISSLMRLHDESPGAGFDLLALQATERWRARGLLELLRDGEVLVRDEAPAELLDREREISAELDALARTRLELAGPSATEAVLRTLEERESTLLLELDRTRSRIRSRSPRLHELTAPDPLDLSRIQQGILDPGTLLLVYFLGEERSFLWVVSRRDVTSHALAPRREIEAAATNYHDILTRLSSRAARQRNAIGEDLSRMLLEPVAPVLGTNRLAVVADGALHYIPFAALPAPPAGDRGGGDPPPDGEMLLDRHEVVHLPSASVLASLRNVQASRERAPKTVAVIADPVFRPDDPRIVGDAPEPLAAAGEAGDEMLRRAVSELGLDGLRRLPHSAEEAEAILQLVPEPSRYAALGLDAAFPIFEDDRLQEFRIVHFATHGLVHRRHAELSGLVLSLYDGEGRPTRGFLRLPEIYGLRLGAELVVLSACETGLGEELEGEGLVGLTRGFLHAGALRVLHSLWSVGDSGAAELMRRFYDRLLQEGGSPAAALRAAQLSMRAEEEWSSPFHWAGFVLQGDWQPTPALLDDDIEESDTGGVDAGDGVKSDEDLPPPEVEPPPARGYVPPPPPDGPAGRRRGS
ncbi:MAG: CHAT domain-containing protein [Thermoanaerobaculia bacterium]